MLKGVSLIIPLTIAAMAPAGGAQAEDVSRSSAGRHFTRGVELAKEDSFAEALIEFKRAYELSPHSSVFYNIGQTYVALDRPVQAVEALSRYLREGGDKVPPGRSRAVEAEITRQQRRIGEVEIVTNLDGARIAVDGEGIGLAPLALPLRLATGKHRVSVSTEGRPTVEQTITLAGEEKRKLELIVPDLPEQAPPRKPTGQLRITCARWAVGVSIDESPASPLPRGQPVVIEPGAHHLTFLAPDGQFKQRRVVVRQRATTEVDCGFHQPARKGEADPSSVRTSRSTLAYVVGGVGLALSVAACAHFAWNLGRYQTWQSNRDRLDPNASDYWPRQQDNKELAESLERASRVTVVLALTGIAGLGTGTWLWLTDARRSTEHNPGPTATMGWQGVW